MRTSDPWSSEAGFFFFFFLLHIKWIDNNDNSNKKGKLPLYDIMADILEVLIISYCYLTATTIHFFFHWVKLV